VSGRNRTCAWPAASGTRGDRRRPAIGRGDGRLGRRDTEDVEGRCERTGRRHSAWQATFPFMVAGEREC
jgi:hypothetical protein